MAPPPQRLDLPEVPQTGYRIRIWHLGFVVLFAVVSMTVSRMPGTGAGRMEEDHVALVEEQLPPPPPPAPPPSPPPPEQAPPEEPPKDVSADPDQQDEQSEATPPDPLFGIPEDALEASGDMAVAAGNTLMKPADTVIQKAPPPLATGFHPEDVRSAYLKGLRRLLEEHRKYPALARRLKQQGSVRVRFSIQADGRIEAVELAEGSSFKALDQGALETVRGIGLYKPIPAGLGLTRWDVELPISYRLE